ncbi:MAG: 50S ribosomal protein L7/L12 [Candidatus Babeliales bacterium]|jgi:large subunit ribosomal protein L7/L12|nr:MAG: 50S ribosomal protein L7/L12 [candidate division TM6 bacterium GW2011_GWF2_36_6]
MSSKIVEEISKMSVMELAELVKTLEEKFGVSAAAPVAAAAVSSAAPVAAAQEEKSEFKVILKEAGADKIKVIKALRTVTTLALGAAKEAVESAPFVVSEAAPKEDAQKIKKALEEAGAKVELA